MTGKDATPAVSALLDALGQLSEVRDMLELLAMAHRYHVDCDERKAVAVGCYHAQEALRGAMANLELTRAGIGAEGAPC